MRQREAFLASYALALERGFGKTPISGWGADPEYLTPAHIDDMLRRWPKDNTGMSDAKQGRWLGWLQGIFCALGELSLDDCKRINMEHSDDHP